MSVIKLIILSVICFYLIACNVFTPIAKDNAKDGYYEIITTLNFDSIAFGNGDTTWRQHLYPVIRLLHENPTVTVMFRTYSSVESKAPNNQRSDYVILGILTEYFSSLGISKKQFGCVSFHNDIDRLYNSFAPTPSISKNRRIQTKIVKKYKNEKYVLLWTVQKLKMG